MKCRSFILPACCQPRSIPLLPAGSASPSCRCRQSHGLSFIITPFALCPHLSARLGTLWGHSRLCTSVGKPGLGRGPAGKPAATPRRPPAWSPVANTLCACSAKSRGYLQAVPTRVCWGVLGPGPHTGCSQGTQTHLSPHESAHCTAPTPGRGRSGIGG